MTGDDHGNGGTAGRFDQFKADSPQRLRRSPTGSASRRPPTSTRTRRSRDAAGRRLSERRDSRSALHVTTNCADWTPRQLESFYTDQLAEFAANYPSLSPPATNRTHCIAWSDWATQPKVELQHGIRLDTNYYYWPRQLDPGPPGDVHRLGHADALRRPRRLDDRRLPGGDPDDRRVGPDLPVHDQHAARQARSARRATTASSPPTCTPTTPRSRARTRSSPRRRRGACRSSPPRQMLTWLDGRNSSSFGSLTWSGEQARLHDRPSAPARTACGRWSRRTRRSAALTGVKRNGNPIATHDADDQGRRVRVLRRRRRELRGDVRSRRHRSRDLATWPMPGTGTGRRRSPGTPTSRRTPGSTTAPIPPDARHVHAEPSALVTSHGVQLTGLAPEHDLLLPGDLDRRAPPTPRRRRRPAGPPKFTTPSASLTDTTVADFGAGTPDANTYVSADRGRRGDPAADRRRRVLRWPGPAFRLVQRHLGLAGRRHRRQRDGHRRSAPRRRRLRRDRPPPTGRAARSSSVANFGGGSFEHVGFGVDFNNAQLGDLQHQGRRQPQRPHQRRRSHRRKRSFSSAPARLPHRYRIEWDATEVRYYVDGGLVATHAANFGTTQMRPVASDLNAGGSERLGRLDAHEPLLRAPARSIAGLRRRPERRLGSRWLDRRRSPPGTACRPQRPHRQHADARTGAGARSPRSPPTAATSPAIRATSNIAPT